MEIRDMSVKAGKMPERKKTEQKKEKNPQIGEDRVELKRGGEDKALALYMKFAIDKNNNKKVDEGETVRGYEGLSPKDADHSGTLKGEELKGVFFEYSKNTWLEAGKSNYMPMEGDYHARVEMKEINLDKGSVNMDVSLELD